MNRVLLISLIFVVAAVAGEFAILRTYKKTVSGSGVTIERTYRGDKCILLEMDDKNRNQKTRMYVMNGKSVVGESDEDGDGFYETVTIFDQKGEVFERFIRSTNGSVTPMDSAKLQYLKSRKATADQMLSDYIRTNQPVGK